MSYKLKNDVFRYRNIQNLDDIQAVDLVRKDNLNIAIDLKGYTKGSRMNIFSQRIAPIQVSFLGYPGTTGSKSID